MKAEIVAVGKEVLCGSIANTNSVYLARQISEAGVEVIGHAVVDDKVSAITAKLSMAFETANIVVATGGLGPTADDVTKEAAAKFFGVEMQFCPKESAKIEGYFKAMGRHMSKNNLKQAYLPKGGEFLPNMNGTASGVWMESKGKTLVLLPGPPQEMQPMFEDFVLPKLLEKREQVICKDVVNLYGIGESAAEHALKGIIDKYKSSTEIATYAKRGEVEVVVSSAGKSAESTKKYNAEAILEIEEALAEFIYGKNITGLGEAVAAALAAKKLKLATAESCTGGLISKMITDVAGVSAVFECGVCSYSEQIKSRVLGVEKALIEQYGVVSPQVASAMAEGVKNLAGADIAVATTGVAGPAGGTQSTPVGMVYIGVSSAQGTRFVRYQHSGKGSNLREDIRHKAALKALHEVLRECAKL